MIAIRTKPRACFLGNFTRVAACFSRLQRESAIARQTGFVVSKTDHRALANGVVPRNADAVNA